MKIVIPGGSGQVGQILARAFEESGDEVIILSRAAGGAPAGRTLAGSVVAWDGATLGDWLEELDGADALINLAGYTVNCRYNAANRARIMNSRVDSTLILGQAMALLSDPPPVWLNAGTATIYRHALDRAMDETTGELGGDEAGGNELGAPEKWNFSVGVARAWEEAFFVEKIPGVRKVALRSAMVMSPDRGGVFDVILGLVRKGLGGTNGSGRQYVLWIHDADFVAAIRFLLERDDLDGPINVCSPKPLPNRDFMAAIRRAWGVAFGLPAPAWLLEIGAIFLRTESELVLKSRRVVPGRLTEAGFAFQVPEWEEAARNLCRRVRERG